MFRFEPERRRADCRIDSLAGRCAHSSDFVWPELKLLLINTALGWFNYMVTVSTVLVGLG